MTYHSGSLQHSINIAGKDCTVYYEYTITHPGAPASDIDGEPATAMEYTVEITGLMTDDFAGDNYSLDMPKWLQQTLKSRLEQDGKIYKAIKQDAKHFYKNIKSYDYMCSPAQPPAMDSKKLCWLKTDN